MTNNINNIYIELSNTKHLLVAGATGSGKSSTIDGIMYAILHKNPAPIVFLIDPKQIDLLKYSNLTITAKYADTPAGALEVLQTASCMMRNRFTELKQFNGLKSKSDRPPVYIVFDEFTDYTGKQYDKQADIIAHQIERELIHISALGRAANIHLIIATQTVLARLIPTELTNNCSVLALHCRTESQSRVLIGERGAESLPEHGFGLINYGDCLQRAKLPLIPQSALLQAIDYWQK